MALLAAGPVREGHAAANTSLERLLTTAVHDALRRNLQMSVPVVYPSPAYYNPYLRDSFWVAQALANERFSTRVLGFFAHALDARGNPPTYFVNAYRYPHYHDDESAALFLIWAWRNRRLYHEAPPRAAEQRVLAYLMSRLHDGFLVTPGGSYTGWWDAYSLPGPASLSYDQGLAAVALRCARALGLGVSSTVVASAERAYRSFYDPSLGYLRLSTTLAASDASALSGEFLSLWLFGRPILSTADVLSTLHHLTPFGPGFHVVALPRVQGNSGGFLANGAAGVAGDYQNGASWLLYDALTIGAAGLHGWPAARVRLQARLQLEFRHGPVFHEYLQTNPALPYYGSEPPARDQFAWDTFAVVVDRALSRRAS
jgi:hypothetical protein